MVPVLKFKWTFLKFKKSWKVSEVFPGTDICPAPPDIDTAGAVDTTKVVLLVKLATCPI